MALNLPPDLEASCTPVTCNHINKNEAWIEVKEIFLKHFVSDSYVKLLELKKKLVSHKPLIIQLEKEFELMLTSTNLDAQ